MRVLVCWADGLRVPCDCCLHRPDDADPADEAAHHRQSIAFCFASSPYICHALLHLLLCCPHLRLPPSPLLPPHSHPPPPLSPLPPLLPSPPSPPLHSPPRSSVQETRTAPHTRQPAASDPTLLLPLPLPLNLPLHLPQWQEARLAFQPPCSSTSLRPPSLPLPCQGPSKNRRGTLSPPLPPRATSAAVRPLRSSHSPPFLLPSHPHPP